MNTDFKSLERRYGTLLALKINEEIARAEQQRFTFYRIPESFRNLHSEHLFDDENRASARMIRRAV